MLSVPPSHSTTPSACPSAIEAKFDLNTARLRLVCVPSRIRLFSHTRVLVKLVGVVKPHLYAKQDRFVHN